jgi:hypothetical protein
MLEKEFPKHLEMRITDEKGKPVENPDYKPFLITEILGALVNRYLEYHGFEFVGEKFKKLYDEMTECVYSKTRKLIVVSPLQNFELKDVNEILISNYRVRELTDWEMQEFISHGYSFGNVFVFGSDFGIIKEKYCVETVVNTPKRHTPPLNQYIEDFITVLRLFKHGNVEHEFILHYPKVWKTFWGMSGASEDRGSILAPQYVLTKEDENSLTLLMKQYLELKYKFPNPIKFAIRWFNKSYRETDPMDRLLDLAIALEVLFGAGDSFESMLERLEDVDEVVVLTDFDPQGIELAYKIMNRLESVGVKVNLTYWSKLRNLLKREIKDVEGLKKLLEILPFTK